MYCKDFCCPPPALRIAAHERRLSCSHWPLGSCATADFPKRRLSERKWLANYSSWIQIDIRIYVEFGDTLIYMYIYMLIDFYIYRHIYSHLYEIGLFATTSFVVSFPGFPSLHSLSRYLKLATQVPMCFCQDCGRFRPARKFWLSWGRYDYKISTPQVCEPLGHWKNDEQ